MNQNTAKEWKSMDTEFVAATRKALAKAWGNPPDPPVLVATGTDEPGDGAGLEILLPLLTAPAEDLAAALACPVGIVRPLACGVEIKADADGLPCWEWEYTIPNIMAHEAVLREWAKTLGIPPRIFGLTNYTARNATPEADEPIIKECP